MWTKGKPVQLRLFKRPDCMENPASKEAYKYLRYLLDGYAESFEEKDGEVIYTALDAADGADMIDLVLGRVGGRSFDYRNAARVYCYELRIIKERYGGDRAARAAAKKAAKESAKRAKKEAKS